MRPGLSDRVGLIAVVTGAMVSLALTVYVGWQSNAPVLIPMFAVWVLAPFLALGWASVASARWPTAMRSALRWTSLVVATGTVAAYAARVASPPRSEGAFVFVVVPIASCLLLAVVAAVVWAVSRRP